jgi:hypothetical protein
MRHRPDIGFIEKGQDFEAASFYAGATGPLGSAQTLPRAAYCSLMFSLLEDEVIWSRSWICVGSEADVPNPGDLLPYSIGLHGVHIERQRDGGLIARFNRLENGGCRVVPLQCKGGSRTPCAYTSCGRSHDRGPIPSGQDGEFARSEYVGQVPDRLLRLKVQTWGPLIFANLDPAPSAFDEPLQNIAVHAAVARFRRAKRSKEIWNGHASNWKLLLAAMTDAAVTREHDHLLVGTTPSFLLGEASSVVVAFPNLVLFISDSTLGVVTLQPTAIGRTLSRTSLFSLDGDSDDALAMDISQELVRRGLRAADIHKRIFEGRDVPAGEASEMIQESAVGHWVQRRLAMRALSRPVPFVSRPVFRSDRSY